VRDACLWTVYITVHDISLPLRLLGVSCTTAAISRSIVISPSARSPMVVRRGAVRGEQRGAAPFAPGFAERRDGRVNKQPSARREDLPTQSYAYLLSLPCLNGL